MTYFPQRYCTFTGYLIIYMYSFFAMFLIIQGEPIPQVASEYIYYRRDGGVMKQ